jgi:excisionase family DNA binding protein
MTNTLLTPDEAAQMLGLSPFTVRRLLRQGELPGRKVGKRQWRIRRVDLEEYLGASSEGNTHTPRQQPQQNWQPQTSLKHLEELAAEQGVKPLDDFDRLVSYAQHGGDEQDEDEESIEEFLAPIYELREISVAAGEV